MKNTFRTVYSTTIHLFLIQAVCLLYTSGSLPLVHAARERIAQQEKPQYDIQSYNDLMDQAQRELSKGGR
jgi:hypothetical protein